jgi:hypothetical protein
MSDWWTYSLSSFLLFSARTYYRLFEFYNADIWPLQIVAFALGLAILFLILRVPAWSGRAVAAILGACWLFVAWAYLLERYDTINFAARYFAVGFALQAVLLTWTGVIRDRLRFEIRNIAAKIGLALVVYALAIHPLIAPLTGRPWTQAEIFGLAPDPTAIATLGVLLATDRPRWHLLVLPLLWCAISGLTLWTMESPEAAVVPALAALSGMLAAWKALAHRRKTQ